MRRRAMLGGLLGAALAGGTAGCLGGIGPGGGSATPSPVDLSGGQQDDRGGMVIGLHGGPNGQIFYAENEPEGHGNPARFHTLSFGLFPYHFERRELGWSAEAIYATDYSVADYDLFEREGRTYVSSPTAPETFEDAEELTYVLESDVLGGMGPDFIPFSDPADARAFLDDHGGRTVGFEDITPGLVASYTR